MDNEFEKRLLRQQPLARTPASPSKRSNDPMSSPRMPRRQITPVNSPQKERYGDRFIPSRAGNNWQVNFNMIQVKRELRMSPLKLSEIYIAVSKTASVMADADKHNACSQRTEGFQTCYIFEVCDILYTTETSFSELSKLKIFLSKQFLF